ncbi:hypothetical protein S7335_822 [Synechococcus sp. PCC 7335]|nr:hypothetical protein S7335_822 [Synechococcus sp. PCC 7335]
MHVESWLVVPLQSQKWSFFELSEMLLLELCDRPSLIESRDLICRKKGR